MIAKKVQMPTKPVTQDKFPISAWGGGFEVPLTDEYYQSLADAGFTMISGAKESELDDAARYGLRLYVEEKELAVDVRNFDPAGYRESFRKIYDRIGQHPALAGYFLQDEPPRKNLETVGKIQQIIREIDPAHESYVNLLPIPGEPMYEEYLTDYFNAAKNEWIGYDYYDLPVNGPNLVSGEYWKNLAIVRKFSLEHHLKFRFVLLSAAHFGYRIPSLYDLNFQAFSALAYGARGLEYFTYTDPELVNFHGAPLDSFGCKTPTWYAAAAVNKRIQVLAPILNRLESMAVYHFSNAHCFEKELAHDLECCPPDSLITENPGREMLVGEFRHIETQEQYIMLVNRELYHSVSLKIVLREPEKWDLVCVSQVHPGKTIPFCNELDRNWLIPGGAMLLKTVPKKG